MRYRNLNNDLNSILITVLLSFVLILLHHITLKLEYTNTVLYEFKLLISFFWHLINRKDQVYILLISSFDFKSATTNYRISYFSCNF